MLRISPLLLAACLLAGPVIASAEVNVTLSGSRASMLRQNRIAKEESFSFLRTPTQVKAYVENGYLVPLEGSDTYRVIAGYPFARPVVRSFVERLSSKYAAACGEQLVVTSLTRPSGRQPRNASPLSVHPAGMAVDLRVSRDAGCRAWLSAELLEMETMGLIDATLERSPLLMVRIKRHHEPRRAEAALRAVALGHRLLNRVERARLLESLDGNELPAVEGAQAQDARVVGRVAQSPVAVVLG